MSLPADLVTLLPELEALARRAGAAIMEVYGSDFAVKTKTDASPVTEADEKAEAIILPGLAARTPGIPMVAEESVAAGRIPEVGSGPFWLIDPLDGTKEFISRNGEFTVKRLKKEKGAVVLYPENPRYKPVVVAADQDFKVWGVVIHVVRSFI